MGRVFRTRVSIVRGRGIHQVVPLSRLRRELSHGDTKMSMCMLGDGMIQNVRELGGPQDIPLSE